VDLASLLRAHSKRPRHCRAAEHAKEFTSPHLPHPAKDHALIVNSYHTQATPVCDIKPKLRGLLPVTWVMSALGHRSRHF
jgi:hypothetical protein